MNPLDLVNLKPLIEFTAANPDIKIGLIDGHVAITHPDISSENIREIPEKKSGSWSKKDSDTCQHGTYGAGFLSAKRISSVPTIYPDWTILRPNFLESKPAKGKMFVQPPMNSLRHSLIVSTPQHLYSN
jgi:hypothetical protein